MALDGEAEAALELSIVAVDVVVSSPKNKKVKKKRVLKPYTPNTVPSLSYHRRSSSWWKPDHGNYAVAWLDPSAKQSTGTLNPDHGKKEKLYFPLHPEILGPTGTPSVTIQIFSRSRLIPFHGSGKLVGSATLSLSAVGMCAKTAALALRRPLGEEIGTVRVVARVLWDLGFRPYVEAQSPICSDEVVDQTVGSLPSAPAIDPMLLDSYDVESSVLAGSGATDPSSVDENYVAEWISTATPATISSEQGSETDSVGSGCPENVNVEFKDSSAVEDATNEVSSEGGHDLGKVVMGLVGAFAAVAVGVACRRYGARPFSP